LIPTLAYITLSYILISMTVMLIPTKRSCRDFQVRLNIMDRFQECVGRCVFWNHSCNLKRINLRQMISHWDFDCYNIRAAGESNATALFMGYKLVRILFHLF
jgi:hypothetical protein